MAVAPREAFAARPSVGLFPYPGPRIQGRRQEGYAGHDDCRMSGALPWVMRRRLRHPDWTGVVRSEHLGGALCPGAPAGRPSAGPLPRGAPVLRNFGCSSDRRPGARPSLGLCALRPDSAKGHGGPPMHCGGCRRPCVSAARTNLF